LGWEAEDPQAGNRLLHRMPSLLANVVCRLPHAAIALRLPCVGVPEVCVIRMASRKSY